MIDHHISHCLRLIESMQRFIRADKWQKLSTLESEYEQTFMQLKAGVAADDMDNTALQAMVHLDQQHRRLQRLVSHRLKETAEKLSAVEGASKRLNTSSQVASILS
ncbi:hypothetical protein Ga0123462_2122 [Mariprofundus ferrinatatus]|uniref:Flagellar protein FliT n=1 Tax=Mariprofundus ferrinatatus TaxID=1921087 RepID=A0A2K8L6Q1_9PROT|nr:hypothetical protein [Mariprofundus ferrinatatus]ATX82957.1 hypothetical protein Ga0123462_2122 [Mariprofundus ferrinatatus]